ncbi:MAG TPA: 50S ribosomal protein L21e [Candidatus Nanoarchaeia archaeon]|nr:50S ribosomal protein L21e [Candidatus Nanoarchaeia archaeon]
MLSRKRVREKGKISFSKYFQAFKEGDSVAVVRELAVPFAYSHRIQGRTGKIIAKRGASYEVEVKEMEKPKRYMIHPIHLKKIEVTA